MLGLIRIEKLRVEMPKEKSTYFQEQWLNANLFPQFQPWLAKHPDSNRQFRCKFCGADKKLSNMGVRAIMSHAESEKHKSTVKNRGKEAFLFQNLNKQTANSIAIEGKNTISLLAAINCSQQTSQVKD